MAACLAFVLLTQTAQATLSWEWLGYSAGKPLDVPPSPPTAVTFEASLTISGDSLTLVLENTSAVASDTRDDLLSSFYFDIAQGASRPTLTLQSVTGNVYLADNDAPDLQAEYPYPDLGVTGYPDPKNSHKTLYDGQWQAKSFDASTSMPFGFGVGTVGSNLLTGYSFDGKQVDGVSYSLYAGDYASASTTASSLEGLLLVGGPLTFTFSGLTGFTEADIGQFVGFGLGSMPDSFHVVVPLPAAALLGMLGLGVAGVKLRKYV